MQYIERPWGFFKILFFEDNYKIKKLVINPLSKLSLQSHNHRNEHWTIIKGTATVQIEDKIHELKYNETAYIPKKAIHRIENNTNEILEIIEIQTGCYLEEDDIIRYQDVYGRTNINSE